VTKAPKGKDERDDEAGEIRDLQLRIGWWALLVFLTLGLALEGLHGFKSGFYLDVSNETRRLMWTLAHAHGALIAVLNIIFALAFPFMPGLLPGARRLASRCLTGALIAMPGGFFLGGLFVRGGDPGVGVLLAPLGGLLLIAAVFLIARGTRGSRS